MASSINASTSGAGGVITTADNTGILNLQTASTNAVTIDASQNVGIGTTSPSYKLQVYGASNPEMRLGDATVTYQLYTEGATAAVMGTVGSHALVYRTNATERMRIDSSGNFSAVIPSGSTSYPAFWCRAWVNFNGTGTVAIRASGNVTSITDNGVGDYTVNFTTAMPDANYSWATGTSNFSNADNRVFLAQKVSTSAPSTTSIRFQCADTNNTASDISYVNIAVFR